MPGVNPKLFSLFMTLREKKEKGETLSGPEADNLGALEFLFCGA